MRTQRGDEDRTANRPQLAIRRSDPLDLRPTARKKSRSGLEIKDKILTPRALETKSNKFYLDTCRLLAGWYW